MRLTRRQWLSLNCLADGSEPLEEVYADWADGEDLDPLNLLDDHLLLFRQGYVVIEQVPLTPAGQAFPQRQLAPSSPLGVVGDLRQQFESFRKTRKYLSSFEGGGIPFGVYVDMTPVGREEWGRQEYAAFVPTDKG